MIVGFTICSNNYLAQAKTAANSFLFFHEDAIFVIGLVDRMQPALDYSDFSSFELECAEVVEIPEFEELTKKYSIIELNTAVKPSFFKYIFEKYKADKVIYIDPDILVTSRFKDVIYLLDLKNIVITPHILTPIDDEFAPTDYHTLRGGVFNLGFIALSNYTKVQGFLSWWHDRVVKYGFADFSRSMFYDQLWINYVPCFFDNYHILKHPGYNMANWNLHERKLSRNNGRLMVNAQWPLVFFHFSGYKYGYPDQICNYLTRYNFDSRPDLKGIFSDYQSLLVANSIELYSQVKPAFGRIFEKRTKRSFRYRIGHRLKSAARVLIRGHV